MGIPATGKVVTWTCILIARFAGGKCVEDWRSADVLGFLQQLGAIPPMAQAGALPVSCLAAQDGQEHRGREGPTPGHGPRDRVALPDEVPDGMGRVHEQVRDSAMGHNIEMYAATVLPAAPRGCYAL